MITGQSFNGFDKDTKKPKFDRLYGMGTNSIEFGIFHRATVEEWNRPAQQWLKYCVHLRVPARNPYLRTFLTFFVSAIWHGFYPMYFYGFAFYAISATNFQYIFKQCVKHSFIRNPIVYFCQHMLLRISTGYFIATFSLLTFHDNWEMTKGVLWLPIFHTIMFILVVLFDKEKGERPTPEIERYSRLKIYDCMSGDAILEKRKA